MDKNGLGLKICFICAWHGNIPSACNPILHAIPSWEPIEILLLPNLFLPG